MSGTKIPSSPADNSSLLIKSEQLPRAHDYLKEVRAGLRKGISPGFLVHEAKPSERPDAGQYDLDIVLWEPYEISSTGIPRNSKARIVMEVHRMNVRTLEGAGSPRLVSTSDPDTLMVEALRISLTAGTLPVGKEDSARTIVQASDAAVSEGASTTEAARKAAQAVGLA